MRISDSSLDVSSGFAFRIELQLSNGELCHQIKSNKTKIENVI